MGKEFNNQKLEPAAFTGLTLDDIFGDKAQEVQAYYEKTFDGESQSF